MYNNFLYNFGDFRKDPKIFLDIMSENILKMLSNQTNNKQQTEIIEAHVNLEHLRQSVSTFLELSLSKIVWSPKDHKNIWNLFSKIEKALEEFYNKKIIDDIDKMDDIYWSLINRFCDLLDITGNELPIEFYANFNNKVLSSQLAMFQIDEQEIAITSKEAHLVNAIISGQAKAEALKKGIIA